MLRFLHALETYLLCTLQKAQIGIDNGVVSRAYNYKLYKPDGYSKVWTIIFIKKR